MNKNPRILIAGTGSLLNYGCEAIIRGTYLMFREFWPDALLVVASEDIDYDKNLFADCEGIEFVPYRKRFTFFRLLMGILRRMGIGKGSPVRMNTDIIRDYDIFLSAGGDNYAEAPDGTLYHILLDLMKIGNNASKMNKLFVLWGASIGPFQPENLKMVQRNLRKADLILTREEISYNYLKTIGFDDPVIGLVADPAFFMDTDNGVTLPDLGKEVKKIGLNISRLSVNHCFTDNKKGIHTLFKALDDVLANNPDYVYVCVPHVFINDGIQDDHSFMKEYIAQSKYSSRIYILDRGIGARKTKGYISQCDLLVAARMHCCISGISSGIPTVFLTYSQKGLGMARYAYGTDELTIDLKNISYEVLNAVIKKGIENNAVYRNKLAAKNDVFRRDASKAVIELKRIYQRHYS